MFTRRNRMTRIRPPFLICNQGGFSLIDLMTVVAILSILVSIAVPNFEKFRQKAIDTEATTFMATMSISQKIYFSEMGGFTNNFFALGVSLEGSLAFDCGMNDLAPPRYGPTDVGNYSDFAPATYLYCPRSGTCNIDLGKHGPGGQNPQGDVNNAVLPQVWSMVCHRHHKTTGDEHSFHVDQTGQIRSVMVAY